MSLPPTAPITRSDKLFVTAFNLALEGNHRDSDELLELAHEMRALELRLGEIAQHAPATLAVLMVKTAMSGFTDDSDPLDYLAFNRDSIRFYAENDQQLRGLINAVFNPPTHQKAMHRLSADELDDARAVLAERVLADPGRRAVSDPIITPASIAIRARGFTEFTVGTSRCSVLRACPDCRNRYSTKVHLNSRIFWHCPHCNCVAEA